MKSTIVSKSLYRGTALILTMTFAASPAWAVLGTQDNAAGIDPSTLQQQAPACGTTCGLIVSDVGEGSFITHGLEQVATPTGKGGWNGGPNRRDLADDQWCADYGQQTNATVLAIAANAPSTNQVNNQTCNVRANARDASRMTCAQVNNNLLRCMMHNSQIESQCLAYAKAKDAKPAQSKLALVDGVAAGICGTVCAAQWVGGPATLVGGQAAQIACAGAGSTAVIAEAVQLSDYGWDLTTVVRSGAVVQGGASSYGGFAGAGGKNACVAAASFTVLSALRYKNMRSYDSTIDQACQSVASLYSNAIAQAGSNGLPPGVSVPSGSGGFAGGVGAGGSQGGDGGGDGSGNGEDSESAMSAACQQMNSAACFGAATAVDSRLLSDSGLDKIVIPEAAKISKGELRKMLAGGAGGIVSAALGSSSPDLAGDLSKLAANAAQKGGTALGGEPAAMMASGGGGGGGGGKSGAEGGGLFGGLFGGGASGGTQGPSPASVNYGGVANNTDIFHSGSTQNLFQIVSDKIGKVQARVGK